LNCVMAVTLRYLVFHRILHQLRHTVKCSTNNLVVANIWFTVLSQRLVKKNALKGAQYKPILAGLHYRYIGRAKGLWRMRRHGPAISASLSPVFTWPDNDTDSNNVLYGIETGKCTFIQSINQFISSHTTDIHNLQN